MPEPCVLHPEQVPAYPHAGILPTRLQSKIDAWEEKQERKADKDPDADVLTYQHNLPAPRRRNIRTGAASNSPPGLPPRHTACPEGGGYGRRWANGPGPVSAGTPR